MGKFDRVLDIAAESQEPEGPIVITISSGSVVHHDDGKRSFKATKNGRRMSIKIANATTQAVYRAIEEALFD